MPKMTLLEIVQKTLSSMDSDDVNSIDDTEESIQVADIAEDTFFELISQGDWEHLNQLVQLESVGDSEKPTHLKMPEDVDDLDTIKYEQIASGETPRSFPTLTFKAQDVFLADSYSMTFTEDTVEEVDLDGIPLFVANNKHPQFWTSFDDEFIIFDSYDNTVDSTIQGNKTVSYCRVIPEWTMTDSFIPDLPVRMFPLFLAEVKNASHSYLKQQGSAVDKKRALRGLNRVRQQGGRSHDTKQRPRFGR